MMFGFLLLSAILNLAGEATTPSIPLSDLGGGEYLGFPGGLYENGTSEPPSDHLAAGLEAQAQIRPLDAAGVPAPDGRIVLLSIGMSNTTQEFCSGPPTRCEAGSLVGQALADPAVDHRWLVLVDGAAGGQTSDTWDSPARSNFDRVRDTRLAALGVTERQVQVAWVKVANAGPTQSLPASGADAHRLVRQMGDIARALRQRYPNLKIAYFSSRIYAGYATSTLNPEPYAYESGLAVKWLVQAQVDQMRNGGIVVDARAGDLHAQAAAPWIGWGPYLWASGAQPRSDGLVWLPGDFAADGTHPATSGREKVGRLLLQFFRSTPTARDWFLAPAVGRRRAISH